MKANQEIPTIRGDRWRNAYRAQVVGILGGKAPQVSSRGRKFYNRNRWTLRVLTTMVCKWARQNPGKQITEQDLTQLVHDANAHREPYPEIVVARTPERLDIRTALALVGGADHEAFHSRYSCLRNISVDEVRFIVDKWGQVPEWDRFVGLLQTWSNVIEDIRIERIGQVEYPGTIQKLHDLQDFILNQEAKGEEAARAHGANTAGSLSIIMRTFRDIGLGYVTPTQETALDGYGAKNPEAVRMVLDGPLSNLLRESIALGEHDDAACLRIAFDVIITLYGLSSKVHCPSCGARGSKLTIRPKRDTAGAKIKGKAVVTCSVCGWEGELDMPEPDEEEDGQEGVDDVRFEDPKFEDFDDKDEKGQGSGGQDGDDSDVSEEEDDEDDDQDGLPDDSDDSDDGSDGNDDSDSSEDDSDGSEGSDDDSDGSVGSEDDDSDGSEDDDSDGSEGSDDDNDNEGDQDDADGDDGEDGADGSDDDTGDEGAEGGDDDADGAEGGDSVSDSENNGDDSEGDDGDSEGAGGHENPKDENPGNDWTDLADDALDQSEDDLGVLDNNAALEEAVNNAQDAEDSREKVKAGEAPYRPLDYSLDEVTVVGVSRQGKPHDQAQAQALLQSVKSEASYLRARLRNIVRALEMTATIHGVRRGRDLSERFLVHTKAALVAGQRPKRAYYDQEEQVDTSVAAAVVLDESWSMKANLKDATRMLCALTEPLDALGCAVQVTGFRNGPRRPSNQHQITPDEQHGCHRTHGVIHDVFKTFDEKFRTVQFRFANTQGTGSTPMSDGIQFALDSLSDRMEGHRLMFVITDGEPDAGHRPIIKRQLRLAKEAGIHIVGVGVGSDARGVVTLYPDHVYDPYVSKIPCKLIAKLNELVDARMASKRGRPVRRTG